MRGHLGIWRGSDRGIECEEGIGTGRKENTCFFGMGVSVWTESVCDHEDVKVCLESSQVPDPATEVRVEMAQVGVAQTVVGSWTTLCLLPLLFPEEGSTGEVCVVTVGGALARAVTSASQKEGL